ncbi:MAG: peptidase M48 [Micavibrio sp.]|nr:MAG: peptidase M48 [Micavibrio sp.]
MYIMDTMKNNLRYLIILAVGISLFIGTLPRAEAQTIIRDTEIENTMNEWAAPIYKAAEIAPDNVHIILVQSDDINAFVAGGANIFFYTGLLTKTDNPDEIIGVLAHELGHISGGHLIATRDALERATYESIIGTIIGIGAAIATGDSGAAIAVGGGASGVAQRRFLAHSRVNESSADQAALSYFETAELSSDGLASFMRKLESEELLPASQQSEYVRTHPITRNRIEALESRAQSSPFKDRPYPPEWIEQHARLKAKLTGFINPGRVPWVYDDRDDSIPARYARAIAAYRENRVNESLHQIDELLALEPKNAYFLELKGQMLVDFGRIAEGIPVYRRSVEILGKAPLIRIALGHALLENGDSSANMKEAITHLDRALQDEPRSARAHRLIATAYGRLGQEDLAKIHLAEEAVLQGNLPYAKHQAEAALKNIKKGSREWLQARDILAHIENVENKG